MWRWESDDRPVHYYDHRTLVPCGTDEPGPRWADHSWAVTCDRCRKAIVAQVFGAPSQPAAAGRAARAQWARVATTPARYSSR
jgi:hypothetical protein